MAPPMSPPELEARAGELRLRIDAVKSAPRGLSFDDMRAREVALTPLKKELRQVQRELRQPANRV
jgi:hypothetical protein